MWTCVNGFVPGGEVLVFFFHWGFQYLFSGGFRVCFSFALLFMSCWLNFSCFFFEKKLFVSGFLMVVFNVLNNSLLLVVVFLWVRLYLFCFICVQCFDSQICLLFVFF